MQNIIVFVNLVSLNNLLANMFAAVSGSFELVLYCESFLGFVDDLNNIYIAI
jgi:hypothetical protein